MKTLSDNFSYPLSDKKNIGNLLGLEFDEDEQILWIGKPDWIIFILNSIIHATLVVLFIFILFIGMNYINQTSIEHRNISGLGIFIALVISIYLISSVEKTIQLRGIKYIITNKCTIRHQSKNGTNKIIDFKYILTKEIKRSLLDRLLKTGNIEIYTGNTKKDEDNQIQKIFYYLYAIKKPDVVLKLIGTYNDYVNKYEIGS